MKNTIEVLGLSGAGWEGIGYTLDVVLSAHDQDGRELPCRLITLSNGLHRIEIDVREGVRMVSTGFGYRPATAEEAPPPAEEWMARAEAVIPFHVACDMAPTSYDELLASIARALERASRRPPDPTLR